MIRHQVENIITLLLLIIYYIDGTILDLDDFLVYDILLLFFSMTIKILIAEYYSKYGKKSL